MKTFNLITTTIILICFNSCKENSIGNSGTKEFYPLSVGNYWNYQTVTFDSVGNVKSDSSFWVEKVIGDTTLNGEKCYFMKQSNSPDSWFIAPYRNSPNGLIMQVDSSITKYLLVYKYPATVNEMFSDSIKVIAVDETISTVAGNLKCMVYQRFYSTLHTDLPPGWLCTNTYVVPGFGKVRIDGFYSSDKTHLIKRVEYRLSDYIIN